MKVTVIGLGYVGITSLACLSDRGFEVVGVEKDKEKVKALEGGECPITEPGVERLLKKNREKIALTSDLELGLESADLCVICVGTPTSSSGDTDLTSIWKVSEELERASFQGEILVRSTVPVGTTRTIAEKIGSAKVSFCPEFLREGTAVHDYLTPSLSVIGTIDGPRRSASISEFLAEEDSKVHWTTLENAEMVKYACNVYHALKITFANEIGRISARLGADPTAVMGLLTADTVLNSSSAYLKPGFAYGGSCLPKDLSSLLSQAGNIKIPLLSSISLSNDQMIDSCLPKILNSGQVFYVNGLAFKSGTDDLRNSPAVQVVVKLLDEGRHVYAYDAGLGELYGYNRDIFNGLLASQNFTYGPSPGLMNDSVLLMFHSEYMFATELQELPVLKFYPCSEVAKIYQ